MSVVRSTASDESDPPLFENGDFQNFESTFKYELSDEEIPLTSPHDHGDKVAEFNTDKVLLSILYFLLLKYLLAWIFIQDNGT